MLTIENYKRIAYRQLDKKNFYVERIIESLVSDPITLKREGRYKIEITNRKYAINVFLDRMPVVNEQNYYRLYATAGIPIYLTIDEIRNMDKFLDKIRLVALG
jgi:hypothetical protein